MKTKLSYRAAILKQNLAGIIFPPVSSIIFSLRDSLLQKQIRSANLGYRGDLTQLAKGVSSKCNCEQSFIFLLRPIDRDNAPAQISPPFCH